MPKFAIPLTATQIRNSKPKDKIYYLSDGGGLIIEISPTGSKIWRMRYRQANGKGNRLSFGEYPQLSLREAREKCTIARKLIADGIDPSENKKADKLAKIEATSNNFDAVAWEWFKVKIESLSATYY